MDGLYDMDNELWDSDFDPAMQEALKMTDNQDLDWPLLDRDFKSGVIYHDKLISDALFGQPIKTEHSYSLNSDGDSIPDSPRSHHNKIDDMDDDDGMLINTKMISTKSTTTKHLNNNEALLPFKNVSSNQNGLTTSATASMKLSKTVNPMSLQSNHQLTSNGNILLTNAKHQQKHHNHHQQQHQQQQYARQTSHILTNSIPMEMECYETDTMDSSLVKDEPLSPDSSCPPSPNASIASSSASIVDGHTLIVTQQSQQIHGSDSNDPTQFGTINVNLANVAAYTNADLVFEHNAKNGSLQLSPASQSLLKNQQIILNGTHQRIVVPKLNIRMDSHQQQTQGFGLPPTPPSSLSSDDSEDNQSAEISYTSTQSLSQTETAANTSKTSQNCSSTSRGYNGSSSRQPIHTPLISNQPKGSTGQLELTEEEKRTLVAEGYPIPTRLPLTKSEEKSLKKIRRKIKNKISAQESRRKKKEYMDKLERQVEVLVSENTTYSKRIETLVETNANLMSQLAKLQALIDRQTSNGKRS